MNILSAIYNGQMGFLKTGDAMAAKADRVSSFAASEEAQNSAASDLVGIKLDAVQAKASLGVVKVADNLLAEFVNNTLKK